MQRLLAVLILYHFNIKILHWKLTGVDFDPVHGLFDDYFSEVGVFVDDVGEMCLQMEIDPLNITEAIDYLNQDGGDYEALSGADYFTSQQAFEKLDSMFNGLIEIYEGLYADPSIPADIVNKLQEEAQWIRKQVRYKNRQRLM
jgi:DNA-binding ferritin-like protein